jgi:hypothetical protein
MLTNRTDFVQTFYSNSDVNMTEDEIRAMRKVKESLAASYALTEFLQHTEVEADRIISDPVYTDSDMKLIAAISPMLAGDLNLVIDSFYTDVVPSEPASCVEVINRMVESFPSEPIVFIARNGNNTIREDANISLGLVRRLLRAKKFVQSCEDERLAAKDYYQSVRDHEKKRLADEQQENAVLVFTPFEIADNAISAKQLEVASNFFKYLAMTKQNDLVTAVVAMSFFGVCALYCLRRPANCLRQGVASVLGLFKACRKPSKKIVDEEETPVFSI